MLPSTTLRDQPSVDKAPAKSTKRERKAPKRAQIATVKTTNTFNQGSNHQTTTSLDTDVIPRIFNVGVKPKNQGEIIDDFPYPIDENL